MEDKKALKILLDAYWSSTGWKNGQVEKEDYEYALDKGYMFEPLSMDHDELISDIKFLVSEITLESVTNAFLYSLTTRKLEYRSALGSYVIASNMAVHRIQTIPDRNNCGICGENNRIKIDRNVLNFERHKWGGVRHLQPEYIWFDLMQFIKTPTVNPTKEDRVVLNAIINTVFQLADTDGVRNLEKVISKIIKSNKAEREVLIQILCYCSILENPDFPGFKDNYINYSERPDPIEHKNDWSYPSFTWRAKYRINKKALNYFFPDYS